MQAKPEDTQVTFHYINGHAESFSVPIAAGEFYNQLSANPKYITFHLFDQSVIVCLDKVVKIEVRQSFAEVQGSGIFPNSQRIMALQRGAMR